MARTLIGSMLVGLGLITDDLDKDVKKANKKLSFFQKQSKSISKGITRSLGSVAAAFAIGGVVTDASKTVMGFEQSIANLASISGKSVKQMGALTRSAIEIGGVSSFSASEVVALQTELAKLGNTEPQIIAMTKSVGDFSVAVGSSAAEAATLTGGVLKSFKIQARDTEKVVSSMAVATTKSALDFNKLNVALPIVGTAASQMGLSLERTTALLGVLSDRNIDASTSGTALRNIFLDLKKKGLTYEEAMSEINNSTDKLNTANLLFGKRGAVVATVLAESGAAADSLEASITDVDGALKRMTDTRLDTSTGKTILLKSAWEGLVLSFDSGNGVLSRAFKGAVEGATALLQSLTKINKLDPAADSIKQRKELDVLLKSLIKNNENEEIRKGLIEELNRKYAAYLSNIDLEKLKLEDVNTALITYDQLNERKIKSLIKEEKRNQLIAQQDKLVKKLIEAEKQLQKNIDARDRGDFIYGFIPAARANVKLLRKDIEDIGQELIDLGKETIPRRRGEGSAVVLENNNSLNNLVQDRVDNLNESVSNLKENLDGSKEGKSLSDLISDSEKKVRSLSEAFAIEGDDNSGLLKQIKDAQVELQGLKEKAELAEKAVSQAFGRSEIDGKEPAKIKSLFTTGQKQNPNLLKGDREQKNTQIESLTPIDPEVLKEISSLFDKLLGKQKEIIQETFNWKEALNTLRDSIASTLAQGADSFGDLAKNVAKSAQSVIGEQLRVFVASELAKSSLFSGGIGLFFAPLIASAAAGVFNTAINSLSVPALAGGGVLTGPTFALLGEYPGANSNPEIAAPQRMLSSIFRSELEAQGSRGGRLSGEIKGRSILLSNNREQAIKNRVSIA